MFFLAGGSVDGAKLQKKNKSIMRGNFLPQRVLKFPKIVSTNDCPRERDDYRKKDLDLKSFLKEKELILNPCITTLNQTIIVTTFSVGRLSCNKCQFHHTYHACFLSIMQT
jgi:hypothetical protein